MSALVSASLNAVRCVPPSVVYWPLTNEWYSSPKRLVCVKMISRFFVLMWNGW